ncbi:MAG: hypothetical protein EXR75_03380 [Myxococcales bacterium]|nr:hypothetical protein [Myxococcales bacterium]
MTGPRSLKNPGFLLFAACVAATAASLAGACFKPEDDFVNLASGVVTSSTTSVGGSDTTATGGMGGTPVSEGGGGESGGCDTSDPRNFFDCAVRAGLVINCTQGACHGAGQLGFLAENFEYDAITTYQTASGLRLITKVAEASLLMTRPATDAHAGGNRWATLPELKVKTLEWLKMEAALLPEITVIEVGPIEPIGLTYVPLDTLGEAFIGSAVTFYGIEHGSSLLELVDLHVYPATGRGIRITDMTVIVLPQGAKVGVTNIELHGDPLTFVAPSSTLFGSGGLPLPQWEQGAMLYLRFEKIEALIADSSGNAYDPCTDVELFTAAVDSLPLVKDCTKPNGLQYCATQCHGGKEGGFATQKMNLSALLQTPRDDEVACAIARKFTAKNDPLASPITTEPNPNSGAIFPHKQFVFCAGTSSYKTYVKKMTPWILAEGAVQGEGGAGDGG